MHGRGCVSIKLYLQKQAVGHTWPVVHRGQTCYGEKQSCRRKAIRLFHGACGSRLSAGVLCHFSSLSLLSRSAVSRRGQGGTCLHEPRGKHSSSWQTPPPQMAFRRKSTPHVCAVFDACGTFGFREGELQGLSWGLPLSAPQEDVASPHFPVVSR